MNINITHIILPNDFDVVTTSFLFRTAKIHVSALYILTVNSSKRMKIIF